MKNIIVTFILIVITLSVSGCTDQETKSQTKEKEESVSLSPRTLQETELTPVIPETKITETGTWKKTWEDSFQNEKETKAKWTFVNRGNNYNNELQYYKKENIEFVESGLRLVASKENYKNHSFTSGQITTEHTRPIQYGRIEVRAKYPSGKGLFPAIWLLPLNSEHSLPEIDLFEVIGSDPTVVYAVNHSGTQKNVKSEHDTAIIKDYEAFHTYAFEWTKEELRFYVDDDLFFRTDKNIPQEEMYLIINLAVGGNWPGNPDAQTVFPTGLDLEFVKIYEKMEE